MCRIETEIERRILILDGAMGTMTQLKREYPIMISGTITDASGRILSGQTIEAFLISIAHAPILSVGLNCALGARELKPYMQILNKKSPFYVSTHPNAGLPNEFGDYNQSAEEFAALIEGFAEKGWLNIVGGCCGTTPDHIKAVAEAIKFSLPRSIAEDKENTIKNFQTKNAIKTTIDNWLIESVATKRPSFKMEELMNIVSQIEDENTFFKLKGKFDAEKELYHSEQAMLLNAQIFGRYQYLSVENRLSRI